MKIEFDERPLSIGEHPLFKENSILLNHCHLIPSKFLNNTCQFLYMIKTCCGRFL